MNTPDTDPFAFDKRLRTHYDQKAAASPPRSLEQLWDKLEAKLPPAVPVAPPTLPRRAPVLAGVGGLVLGILLTALVGWWLVGLRVLSADHTSTGIAPAAPTVTTQTTTSGRGGAGSEARTLPSVNRANTQVVRAHNPGAGAAEASYQSGAREARVTAASKQAHPTALQARPTPSIVSTASGTQMIAGSGLVSGTDSTERTHQAKDQQLAAVPTVLQPLVQLETTLASALTDTTRSAREQRRAALRRQRAELARLQYRTDSLLLAAGEPGVWSAVPAPVAAAEPLTNRWSVALTFAPERNFFGLGTPAADTLNLLRRTHEQGRGGYNAALLAEYRLSNRLSLGAGLGISSYGAELRLTDRRTLVTVTYDTAVTRSTRTDQVTTGAYSVLWVADFRLTPHFNLSGHVIGYDTIPFFRPDTTWTYLTHVDSVTTTTRTVTPKVTKREEVSARILKPDYRFLTVPFLLRYRLGKEGGSAANRWWADVSVGAQLQVFLGGTQLTTLDGRTYQTERVSWRGGPFRPVNVAVQGAVALNYALTPRFSVSVAPTLRYQLESVYKPATNLSQRPAATGIQLGLRYAF